MTWPTRASIPLICVLAGCPSGDEDPCDSDSLGCDDGNALVLDPSCTLTGDLMVALGQGEKSYSPLSMGEAPKEHFGPQGGSHLWLGARVEDHARDYPQLELDFDLVTRAENCGEMECEWQESEVGGRTVVLDEEHLELTDDGAAEAAGILVFADFWSSEGQAGVRLGVRDPCGRTGSVVHAIDERP